MLKQEKISANKYQFLNNNRIEMLKILKHDIMSNISLQNYQ